MCFVSCSIKKSVEKQGKAALLCGEKQRLTLVGFCMTVHSSHASVERKCTVDEVFTRNRLCCRDKPSVCHASSAAFYQLCFVLSACFEACRVGKYNVGGPSMLL